MLLLAACGATVAAGTPPAAALALEPQWERLKLEVVGFHAADSMIPFFRACGFWVHGHACGKVESVEGDLRSSRHHGEPTLLMIQGDCLADVTVPAGSLVLVRGDLAARLILEGQSEAIIGGRVRREASILTTGIASVWVENDLEGRLTSLSSLHLVVGEDLTGRLDAGYPSTRLHVGGRLSGTIVAARGTVNVDVEGYASFATLQAAGKSATELKAVVGTSDLPKGIHALGRRGFLVVNGDSMP